MLGCRGFAAVEADGEAQEHGDPEGPEPGVVIGVEVDGVGAGGVGEEVVADVVDQEFEADDGDEEIGGGFEAGEFFEELDKEDGGKAHEDDAEKPAGDDDPEFVVEAGVAGLGGPDEGDGGEDGVDGEGDVGQLDHQHREPEPGAGVLGEAGGMRAVFVVALAALPEVFGGDVDEVTAAEEFDPGPLEEEGGSTDSEKAEDERADEAVGQGFPLLGGGQVFSEQAQDERIVDRQNAFENNEKAHDGKVVQFEGLAEVHREHGSPGD